ncbi:MAG: sugar phosphate isomerase/epimerase family protein [Candidatus Cyclobacteriaceae bacterium M3_2C_046]
MLQLGFMSAIMADQSFEQVIDFAAEHQFSCVEVMCWPKGKAERKFAGVTHIDLDELDDQKIKYIKNYVKEKQIDISGLGYYPNPLDPDTATAEKYIEHIKGLIVAAKKLEIPVVNTFIGRDQTKNIEDNFKIFKDRWPAIIKVAEENNIKIGIENCPMYFTGDEWPGGKNLAHTPAIWEKMFEAIPSPLFGLNYDPSHMIWQQMDEIKPIFEFKHRIFHIHLKDVKVYKDLLDKVGIMATPLEYHSPKIPGLGDVRWRDFFSALTSIGYEGPCCIEVEDKAFEGSVEKVKASLLTSRNYLRQFFA